MMSKVEGGEGMVNWEGLSPPYRTIVADPPWPYRATRPVGSSKEHRPLSYASEKGPSASARYSVMGIDQIAALVPPADEQAHLYLWTTNAFICEAHEIAKAWGFIPKTVLTWVKVRSGGEPSMRMGYWFRGATEHIVFGVRGGLRLVNKAQEPTAFLWKREPHSVKPAAFYDLVERVSPGPFLEMFARQQRMGWDSWGWGYENVG